MGLAVRVILPYLRRFRFPTVTPVNRAIRSEKMWHSGRRRAGRPWSVVFNVGFQQGFSPRLQGLLL